MTGHFLSCDWGTSNFRLRLVETDTLRVVASTEARMGVAKMAEDPGGNTPAVSLENRYRTFFCYQANQLLAEFSGVVPVPWPAVVSGMASSSIGWRELPYASVPFHLDGRDAALAPLDLDGQAPLQAWLVSGLRTATDVMRGEETEVIGLYATDPWRDVMSDALVVLPGTHSKHVQVRSGAIQHFQTYPTGEMFELLATQSIFRHSVDFAALTSGRVSVAESGAFREGVEAALQESLVRGLFRTRTHLLFQKFPMDENTGYLFGLLVGAEVRDALELLPAGRVLLAASGKFADAYRRAFELAGAGERLHFAPSEVMDQAVLAAHRLLLGRIAASPTETAPGV